MILPTDTNTDSHEDRQDRRCTRIDRARVERAARIYASNKDAAVALGIIPQSFSRLCRRYGIETPQVRQRRQQREAQERRRA